MQFAGQKLFVECADNLDVTTELCQGTNICVLDGTTHIDAIISIIPEAQLIAVAENEVLHTYFTSGVCNVIAGEEFDIAESLVRERGYVVHSKESL
jgi:hypothetical protein